MVEKGFNLVARPVLGRCAAKDRARHLLRVFLELLHVDLYPAPWLSCAGLAADEVSCPLLATENEITVLNVAFQDTALAHTADPV